MGEFVVDFREKSDWQKDTCLFCADPVVWEAYAYKGPTEIAIRCCNKGACKDRAEQMALDNYNKL